MKIIKLLFCAVLLSAATSLKAQQTNEPVLSDISEGTFVMYVSHLNCVVSNTLQITREAFDPYELDQYAQFRFIPHNVKQKDGTTKRFFLIQNAKDGSFLTGRVPLSQGYKEFQKYYAPCLKAGSEDYSEVGSYLYSIFPEKDGMGNTGLTIRVYPAESAKNNACTGVVLVYVNNSKPDVR